MNNAKSLLDSFLGQVQGATGADAAPGAGTPGAAAPLGGGLDAVKNAAGQMNLQGLLSGKGGLVAAAAAGGLAGLLVGGKKTRKMAGTALKVGGVALVGGLAYKAWRDWQANKPPEPVSSSPSPVALPAPDDAFMPSSDAEQEDLSRDLIRAMIAAAKADGHIDDAERTRIGAQLDALELTDEHRAFVKAELAEPLDIGKIAESARTPERAAEIYAASLLAIDPEGPAEKGYLAMLAARLNLDPGLVAHLHANAGAVTA